MRAPMRHSRARVRRAGLVHPRAGLLARAIESRQRRYRDGRRRIGLLGPRGGRHAHAGAAGEGPRRRRLPRAVPHLGPDDGHRRVQRRSIDAGALARLRSDHADPRQPGRLRPPGRRARHGDLAGLRRGDRDIPEGAVAVPQRAAHRRPRRAAVQERRDSRVAKPSRRRPTPPPPRPIAMPRSSRCAPSAWTTRASPPCARGAPRRPRPP